MKKEIVGTLDTDTLREDLMWRGRQTQRGDGYVNMEAETELKLLPTKENLRLLVAERVKEGSPT